MLQRLRRRSVAKTVDDERERAPLTIVGSHPIVRNASPVPVVIKSAGSDPTAFTAGKLVRRALRLIGIRKFLSLSFSLTLARKTSFPDNSFSLFLRNPRRGK